MNAVPVASLVKAYWTSFRIKYEVGILFAKDGEFVYILVEGGEIKGPFLALNVFPPARYEGWINIYTRNCLVLWMSQRTSKRKIKKFIHEKLTMRALSRVRDRVMRWCDKSLEKFYRPDGRAMLLSVCALVLTRLHMDCRAGGATRGAAKCVSSLDRPRCGWPRIEKCERLWSCFPYLRGTQNR